MSKSKGNVIPLVEIPKKYGADVYRTYAVSAAEPGSLLDWRERDVPAVRNRLNQFIQIMKMYGSKTPHVYTKKDGPSTATRWVLSKVNSIVQASTECMDSFRIRDYAILSTSEMIRIINQYLKRDVPKAERESTMAYICDVWVRLMAPITPHTSEEMWEKMKRDGYVSLAPWPHADKKLISSDIETSFEVVDNTVRDTREIIRLLKGKRATKVYMYVAPQWMFDAMNSIREANMPLIVKNIMQHLMSNSEFRQHGKEIKGIVDRIAKENALWNYGRSAKDEYEALKGESKYIASEVGLTVEVHYAEKPDYDPQNKARFALPGRVSLFIE